MLKKLLQELYYWINTGHGKVRIMGYEIWLEMSKDSSLDEGNYI